MISINYKGLAFPLLLSMLISVKIKLPRDNLLSKLIHRTFRNELYRLLKHDREFVKDKQVEYLNENRIKIFIIPKNKKVKVAWLFKSLRFEKFGKGNC